MAIRHMEPSNAPQLPSYPEGWYFIASREAIQKAGLIQKTWMGENIVVWGDEGGRICVAEAYCAHLGSDLGPSTGGCVRDGRLICPFHGFEYDATGQCVATPHAPPPRAARLRVFETAEIAGLIFAWWGIDGWSSKSIRTLRFPGHPQDTTENSVDLTHLRYVHRYGTVDRVGEVSVEGAHFQSHFNFRSIRKIARFIPFSLDVSAKAHIFGLGYSLVDIHEHGIGMDMRLWVLATPVDGTLIDLSLVSQVREIRNPKRWIVGLGFLPVKLRAPIMNRIIAPQQEQDVWQDITIWSRKQYRPFPRLSRADGEIMTFRAYCAQFYPDLSDPTSPTPAAHP